VRGPASVGSVQGIEGARLLAMVGGSAVGMVERGDAKRPELAINGKEERTRRILKVSNQGFTARVVWVSINDRQERSSNADEQNDTVFALRRER